MATIIDGKLVADTLKVEIKEKVQKMKDEIGKVPGLAIILVGTQSDSQTYTRMKRKACENLGIIPFSYNLEEKTTEEELIELINKLNSDESIHGIMVQLPLPNHINITKILDSISVDKDVDGLSPDNIGKIAMKGRKCAFCSCTPKGCIALLDFYKIPIAGKHVVVLGKSNLVGLPLSLLLIHRNATVTVCTSYTTNEADIIKTADILISAIGKPKFVQAEWLKEGCVVIDVGINSIDDPTSKKGYKLVGDVDFEHAKEICSYITPVPGGVGPMTITMLMSNTYDSAYRHFYHQDNSSY